MTCTIVHMRIYVTIMSCDLKLHEGQYLPYFMLSLHMSFLSRSAVIVGLMVDLKLQHSANFKKDMKIPANCYNTNTDTLNSHM